MISFIIIRYDFFLLVLLFMKKNKNQLIIACFFGIIISIGVGFLSSLVTRDAIPTWYKYLNKPFFSPPNWLFSPVWTLLYTLMGIAVGRVWFYGKRHELGKKALYYFIAQLIFNGLWSLVFFWIKSPFIALLVIFILWILILRSIYWFRFIDRNASLMLYPYLAWVSFATILNISILYLN